MVRSQIHAGPHSRKCHQIGASPAGVKALIKFRMFSFGSLKMGNVPPANLNGLGSPINCYPIVSSPLVPLTDRRPHARRATRDGPLYTIPALIKTRHFQKSCAGSFGERKCIPAVAQRKVRVVVPDLAITAGPADHHPFRIYWRRDVIGTNLGV